MTLRLGPLPGAGPERRGPEGMNGGVTVGSHAVTPADTLHCAALVSPAKTAQTKERGTSPDPPFLLFGQLSGPQSGPGGIETEE